jgi:serine/threonine protein kinase
MIGRQIAHFQIEALLGAGGMGEVYLGLDSRLRRQVALKGLIEGDPRSGDLSARVLREARAAARLHHENIAGVYDVIEHDGRPFIVMEYVEGESLSARLRRGTPSVAEIQSIGRQLASALAAAHVQGVIHRDLKPGNIQVTPDGSIRVLDFGVAKLTSIRSEGEADTDTAAFEATLGGNPGTVVYMSPEQLMNKEVDGRSDIYSAGVMLFEMATGRRPFDERDPAALAVAIASQRVPAVRSINAEIPVALSDTNNSNTSSRTFLGFAFSRSMMQEARAQRGRFDLPQLWGIDTRPARRAGEQYVIEGVAAGLGGFDEHLEIGARLFLADELGQPLRAQRRLNDIGIVLGARDEAVVGHGLF